MVEMVVPGWGSMEIEHIVIDLNGTIATDGKISPDVREKINLLSEKVAFYILTADTLGTADEEGQGLNAQLIKIGEKNSKEGKLEFLTTLPQEKTVAIGNGSNDQFILKEAALGIAVIGEEGLSGSAMKEADIIVKDISHALDLFLKPKRLIATLRE